MLAHGESMQINGYQLTYNGLREERTATHTEVFAPLSVTRNGQFVGNVEPQKNLYLVQMNLNMKHPKATLLKKPYHQKLIGLL